MSKVLLAVIIIELTAMTPQVVSAVKAKAKELAGHEVLDRNKLRIEIDASERIAYWTPSLTKTYLPASSGSLFLPNTEIEGYHALVTEQQKGRLIRTRIRYLYRQGRDIEASSDELIAVVKSPLQIEPGTLPNPEIGFESARPYTFNVRLHGKPLSDTAVSLETTNGTRMQGETDAMGRVNFSLPDDFKDRSEVDSAQVLIRVLGKDPTATYQTELILDYHKDKSSWLALEKGVAWCAQLLMQRWSSLS